MVDMNWAPDSLISSFPTADNSAKSNGAVAIDNVEIHNLEIDVLALDNDVLTLNSPYAFMRANTIGDLTVVSEFRNALDVIHNYTGFASITGIGNLATSIAKSIPGPKKSSNNHLIIVDRATDLITPLVTQMNYEGLIADLIGIDCGVVELEVNGKKQLEILSSTIDKLFESLRSMTHTEASNEMESKTSLVSDQFSKKANETNGLDVFRETAKTALENQTLIDHINIATQVLNKMKESRFFRKIMNAEADLLSGSNSIKELATEMLEYGEDFRSIIRMLSLEFLLRGGFNAQDYNKFVNFIIFNYGFQMVPYLFRLQEAGLFGQSGTKWNSMIKTFHLYVNDFEETCDQAAYTYLGYAPLSVRYVQKIINGEFATVQKSLSDFQQECIEIGTNKQKKEGNFLICYVGGCTHSELNSFRRLEERDPDYQNTHFQLLTTDLFSSNSFFDKIAYQIPGWSPLV